MERESRAPSYGRALIGRLRKCSEVQQCSNAALHAWKAPFIGGKLPLHAAEALPEGLMKKAVSAWNAQVLYGHRTESYDRACI